MALSRFLQLHNSYYHGTSSSSFPKTAANLALSSLIPHFSPSLPSFSRSCTASGVPAAQLASDHHHHQHLTSPELVALEYADLNLSYKLVPAQAPDWNQVFGDPTLPLTVDIGCGSGRLLLWLAKQNPDVRNYLGLEIRQKLVKRAEVWAKDLSLNNIHFLFANATISFKQLVTSYPGPLMFVSILCPDPHFKKRHHKRRVLQKPLVDAIIDTLMPDGQVLIQSDVLEVALDMRNQFDEVEALKHMDAVNPTLLCDSEGWLLSNPMGIRTEREIHAELEGSRIYRRMYLKQI
ncbi:tRNA (guanine-N(7)-)-methyltransferase [Senna tora]|uniref:tRNA (guanine(46)-N(7))-methyltransferase n=1 Tax=Senna tora TaxID=362788 RepID=A0A834TS73_9FABA|nr:tRNA (guanine-N(7)-)-methyltransferase [Senna tora]